MKKFLFSILLVSLLFLTGCGKDNAKDIKNNVFDNIDKLKSYYQEAKVEIVNNDDVYEYDVKISYQKPDYYKVVLKNQSNNYEQTILKNKDGVYVITPSLNKSFKFQSEWPYNNSQAYLLKSVKDDLDGGKDIEFIKENDTYKFTTTNLNYPNNPRLVEQEIIVDKDYNIKEVRVLDANKVVLVTAKYGELDKNPTFENGYFDIDENSETLGDEQTMNEVATIEEAIFPLYLPTGTVLSNQEKVNKDDGERIIMTFSGEKPFLLVEETASRYTEFTIIPTSGEPFLLIDTVGSLTNESISWTANGIDYYIVSDVMTQKELIEVAQSINTIPVMK